MLLAGKRRKYQNALASAEWRHYNAQPSLFTKTDLPYLTQDDIFAVEECNRWSQCSNWQFQFETALARIIQLYIKDNPGRVNDVLLRPLLNKGKLEWKHLLRTKGKPISSQAASAGTDFQITLSNNKKKRVSAEKEQEKEEEEEEGEIMECQDDGGKGQPSHGRRENYGGVLNAFSDELGIPKSQLLQFALPSMAPKADEFMFLFNCLTAFMEDNIQRGPCMTRRVHQVFLLIFDENDLAPYRYLAKCLGEENVLCFHEKKAYEGQSDLSRHKRRKYLVLKKGNKIYQARCDPRLRMGAADDEDDAEEDEGIDEVDDGVIECRE